MVDGSGLQLSDYASFALYHMKRNEKIIDKSFKDDVQIMFADLTPEQMATTFVESFGKDNDRREQLENELKYSMLLEITGWLANNLRFGCVKCAPFLTRQKIPMYPLRPQQLIQGRQ